jgi:hypothetical protein
MLPSDAAPLWPLVCASTTAWQKCPEALPWTAGNAEVDAGPVASLPPTQSLHTTLRLKREMWNAGLSGIEEEIRAGFSVLHCYCCD